MERDMKLNQRDQQIYKHKARR